MSELDSGYVEYEAAKLRWESFETENEQFSYPRKNYQYVARIVHVEGNHPDSVARALKYFDNRMSMWLLRAEAYQNLADELPTEQAQPIARTVYEFSSPLLAAAPRHGDPDNYPTTEEGTRTFDNILSLMSWAVAKSGDPQLIASHRLYMRDGLAADLRARGTQEDDIAQVAAYFNDRFEVKVNPRSYCVRERFERDALSDSEKRKSYAGCLACGASFFIEHEGLQQIDDNSCNYA